MIPLAPGGAASTQAPPIDLPLRFFLVTLAAILVLAVGAPWETAVALSGFYDTQLIVFVHINTLGFISATVFGASYQMLPVVLQSPIASVPLARLTWWLLVPGIVAFALGLLTGIALLLAVGGVCLLAAVWTYVGIVAKELLQARDRDVVYWHVAVATVALAVSAALGATLALSKPDGMLGGATFAILAAHATLMLGGWVTPLITGIAYRLIGMFTLAEDRLQAKWAWLELALTSSGAWVLAAGILAGLPVVRVAGGLALFAGILVFTAQLLRLYRGRRRRSFDVHVPYSISATVWAIVASSCLVLGLVTMRPAGDLWWVAIGWLAVVGWAETLIQGSLYKIGTFLTWLHRYAPVAGRQRVPKLESLYHRRTALVGCVAWNVGVALEAIALLRDSPWLAHVAAGTIGVGLASFLLNALLVGSHWVRKPITPAAPLIPAPAISHRPHHGPLASRDETSRGAR